MATETSETTTGGQRRYRRNTYQDPRQVEKVSHCLNDWLRRSGYASAREAAEGAGIKPRDLRSWKTRAKGPDPKYIRQIAVAWKMPILEYYVRCMDLTPRDIGAYVEFLAEGNQLAAPKE